ncbi:hypothetical protein UPYG_G00280160 [Umbra pygmaea]|uniref:V-SNARE coiled-coil homology domain-containing protein n=1 Tax=Umbra pygmaea TaxID=75934 RepID=A0ABD0W2Z3_UMBPY
MSSRLHQAQEAAEEVKVIMLENMEKAEERTEKLQDLDERAEELTAKSKSFEKTTMKVKEQKKCDDIKAKWKLIAVVLVSALLIILVAILMMINRSSPEITHGGSNNPTHTSGITPSTNGTGK